MKKYFYSDGKEKYGPFSFEEMKVKEFDGETLIWYEGLEDWTPAKYVLELEEILQLSPPPLDNVDTKNNSEGNGTPEVTRELEAPGVVDDVEIPGIVEDEQGPDLTEDKESDERNANGSDQKSRVMFSGLFSFKGRIRRTEYGISVIIYIIIMTIINVIIESEEAASILILAYIPMLWFLFAQGAKRCHDTGTSGWYQIIPFYMIYMIFAKGEEGLRNRYGINPKL